MHFIIYQINLSRDKNRAAFLGYTNTIKKLKKIDKSVYDKIYEDDIDIRGLSKIIDILEKIYRMFNLRKPEDYTGRSLSVSDVVEITADDVDKFYFCDSIGWKEINFEEDK